MPNEFVFENHLGQRFEGLPNGVFLNQSDLRDYSWSYDTINDRISRFYRGVTERKIPLVVHCDSAEKAFAVMNRLHELAEADIDAMLPGKIRVGEYYTSGYIRGSAKSNYQKNKKHCKIELTFVSDDPMWFREKAHVFNLFGNTQSPELGVDFPHDYPHDLAPTGKAKFIQVDAVRASDFQLRIYGGVSGVENPAVTIGGHTYKLNGTINSGESVLIDSTTKTITLNTSTGGRVNWFDKRDRSSYIFKPIPKGRRAVSWDGTFGFDLTIIEKRSEPKWT